MKLQSSHNPPLAVVTGAAHRLGRILAIALAKEGFAIGLHYHSSLIQAEETAEEIRKLNVPVYLLEGDLTDLDQIDRLFDKLSGIPSQLNVLVNSAAVFQRQDILKITGEDWDKIFALNLRAPFFCSQQAAHLMSNEGGLIVNISDAGAARTWTGHPAYIASKAGLESITRLFARSLAPKIRVNAIAPGTILLEKENENLEWKKVVDRLPLKRAGTPDEIAETLLFLINNQFITGQTIVVDGGYQLQ